MHYVDEGSGDAIVFVHGTPTWSFVWRQQIKSLSRNYRCIAPDHLGFGLSDKPANFPYTPAAHADNLEALIEHLQLRNITLVVHDFGGPIGLRYALRHPANVKNLMVLNSWMWSLEEEKQINKISRFMSGSIGRFLYLQLNFSARMLLPRGYHERKNIPKDIHTHYLKPLSTSTSRLGTWKFLFSFSSCTVCRMCCLSEGVPGGFASTSKEFWMPLLPWRNISRRSSSLLSK